MDQGGRNGMKREQENRVPWERGGREQGGREQGDRGAGWQESELGWGG